MGRPLLGRGRDCFPDLNACSDSFLLSATTPDYIRGYQVLLMGGWLFAHCRASRQWHAPGGEDIEYLLFLWGLICCLVVWFLWFCCMLDYFGERHGGVKGDEKYHVAIRVDRGPTCCDVEAVPGRSFAMCGDPQAHIPNEC